MEQKHQGLPAYGHALADEATKTLEMLQRTCQPKTEDPVASLSSAGPAPKADTKDSSSDSASSTDEDLATEEAVSPSVTEPQELTQGQAFMASGLLSEPGMPPLEDVPSLDDMPPLEEVPPPRFPLKKR